MKKLIVAATAAWIIWATTYPSKLAIEPSSIISPVIDNTNSRVLSLLPKNELLDQYIIPDKNEIEKETSKNDCNKLLFPSKVQTIWVFRMAKGFLWNMSHWWFNVIHPPLVDVWWEKLVYCAWTIKGFFGFSKKQSDRSKEEDIYVYKEWIDAWILPNELKKLWFEQRINLMSFFDENKVGEKDIVEDKGGYKNWLLEVWHYLNEKWKPGSLLFMYFNLSNYKWKVREYNQEQKQKNPNYAQHINTHQAMYLWKGSIEFKASEVKIISNSNTQELESDIDIINYIANFVQQRWCYKSALNDNTKNIIIENLAKFWSLVQISVNWELVNVIQELKKSPALRKQINKNDIINISWPVLMDWFHNANSRSKAISEYNHSRTMFYFEFVLPGSYTPSELMEPNDNFYKKLDSNNDKLQILIDKLEVSNLYHLKLYEDIDLKLKEAILRYRFWKHKLLEDTEEDIDFSNRIEEIKWSKVANELIIKFVIKKREKIKSIIQSLSKEESKEFEKEYLNQIRWLQMMWYLQHEGQINDWTTNINAPIPYFNTTNIEEIFSDFIAQRKEDLSKKSDDLCNNWKTDKYITIYFYPMDNFARVFSQVEANLQNYKDRYPNFRKISSLNLLKRNKFIDLIIDKVTGYDISNWNVPSMRKAVVPLDYINTILTSLLEESFVDELQLSEIDGEIIKHITENKDDRNFLSYIITQENYEEWIPFRKFLKKIWRELDKTSSYWDYQLKLYNLFSEEKSLNKWPSAEQLNKAISYIENPKLRTIIDRRLRRFDEVEPDLKIVEQLKKELSTINEENRIEKGKKIYELLKELFRFNDTREINIVWKIIQASLVLDKLHEHFSHLNWWLEKSWVLLDDIYYSKDLQRRYIKMLLSIHHRSEKIALIWNAENYVLRIMESLWDDINDKNYPKLKKDFKGHIDYDNKVVRNHFEYYKERLQLITSDDMLVIELKKELNKELTNIINGNIEAEDIYKLFNNKIIKKILEKNWKDIFPIPTIEEFKNTPFRKLFFDYAETPTWRTAPKIYKTNHIVAWAWALGSIILWWIITFFVKRSKKKKKIIESKKSDNVEIQNNMEVS